MAKKLNKSFPHVYKDPNHKPEMVIALTKFECMCGLLKLVSIYENMKNFPEFKTVLDGNGILNCYSIYDTLSLLIICLCRQCIIRENIDVSNEDC